MVERLAGVGEEMQGAIKALGPGPMVTAVDGRLVFGHGFIGLGAGGAWPLPANVF